MRRSDGTPRRRTLRIGHTLEPLDIVLVNTRAGARYGHDDFVNAGAP